MSNPRRHRCTRCEHLRAADSFTRKRGWCRACQAEYRAKRRGDRKVVNIIKNFGTFDDELRAALGSHWPQRLLRAKEGRTTR
jgi:hypothetical protein